ncbi:MAG: glycosyltransferase [Bacteroidaceae bacterium]|nr:glycosyltransferase [Bacteroidaceae bacterium]
MLSVVIPSHNHADALRYHLPAVLAQDYEDFEVIVVDVASTDETKDVLESLEANEPRLHHTFTPASARDISLERLALTLGIRAAKYDWVVITRADCQPASDQWLRCIADTVQEGKDIIIGVAKYDESHRTWFDLKTSFFRLWNTLANLRYVKSGEAAVRADDCNVAIRRSAFLEKDGFGQQVNLLTGAVELLVNRLSNYRNTVTLTSPEAIVIQDRLSEQRLWKQQRTFYMETRRHQRHTFGYRVKQNLRMALPWFMLFVGLSVWPLVLYFDAPRSEPLWLLLGLIALLFIIILTYFNVSFNRAAAAIGYQRLFHFSLPILSLLLPLWNVSAWFRHRFTPKNEFRKKFI